MQRAAPGWALSCTFLGLAAGGGFPAPEIAPCAAWESWEPGGGLAGVPVPPAVGTFSLRMEWALR